MIKLYDNFFCVVCFFSADGNVLQFEDGYLVETVVEGNAMGVVPYKIRVSEDGELYAVDEVNSNVVKITPPLSQCMYLCLLLSFLLLQFIGFKLCLNAVKMFQDSQFIVEVMFLYSLVFQGLKNSR
jgi:hypothetical protein